MTKYDWIYRFTLTPMEHVKFSKIIKLKIDIMISNTSKWVWLNIYIFCNSNGPQIIYTRIYKRTPLHDISY